MIDFTKRLYALSMEGFEAGFFTSCRGHLKFHLIHTKKPLRVDITVCYHEEHNPKYHGLLVSEEKVLFEKKAETQAEMLFMFDDIALKTQELAGTDD